MATFITTIKFTQQGIKAIDETTKRAAALKASAKKMGVKVTDIYWTLGDHDGFLIFEAPTTKPPRHCSCTWERQVMFTLRPCEPYRCRDGQDFDQGAWGMRTAFLRVLNTQEYRMKSYRSFPKSESTQN